MKYKTILSFVMTLMCALPASAKTFTVEIETIDDVLVRHGEVISVKSGTISAKTLGTIDGLNFKVNQFVHKDDILLTMKSKLNAANLEKSKAALKGIQADIQSATAIHKKTKKEYQRIHTLYKAKNSPVTLSEIEAIDARFESVKSTVRGLREKLRAGKMDVAIAEEAVANQTVRAPFDGYVLRKFVEVGDAVQPGKVMIEGFSTNHLRVDAAVSQRYHEIIQNGQPLYIVPEYSKDKIQATVESKQPTYNRLSHDLMLRLRLDDSTGLRPGMLVKSYFKVGEKKVIRIPEAAVVRRSEVVAVYVIKDEKRVLLRPEFKS